MSEKVSVLVNCYNGERYLKQCLDSIYRQTYQNFEIVFVDNCSTDRSLEIAKSYDERLKICQTPENIPLYSARNFGLQFVTGDYLCFLDVDDLWFDTKLEKQIRVMQQTQSDFIFCRYKVLFENSSCFKKGLYKVFEGLNFSDLEEGQIEFKSILKDYRIAIAMVMLRNKKIKNLKFKDKLNHIGDMEFFLRTIKQASLKVYYIHEVLGGIRIHAGQLSHAPKRNWLKEYRYAYWFSLSHFLDTEEKRLFKRYIDIVKYQDHMAKGLFKKARKNIQRHKFVNIEYFFHYLKSLIGLR